MYTNTEKLDIFHGYMDMEGNLNPIDLLSIQIHLFFIVLHYSF